MKVYARVNEVELTMRGLWIRPKKARKILDTLREVESRATIQSRDGNRIGFAHDIESSSTLE